MPVQKSFSYLLIVMALFASYAILTAQADAQRRIREIRQLNDDRKALDDRREPSESIINEDVGRIDRQRINQRRERLSRWEGIDQERNVRGSSRARVWPENRVDQLDESRIARREARSFEREVGRESRVRLGATRNQRINVQDRREVAARRETSRTARLDTRRMESRNERENIRKYHQEMQRNQRQSRERVGREEVASREETSRRMASREDSNRRMIGRSIDEARVRSDPRSSRREVARQMVDGRSMAREMERGTSDNERRERISRERENTRERSMARSVFEDGKNPSDRIQARSREELLGRFVDKRSRMSRSLEDSERMSRKSVESRENSRRLSINPMMEKNELNSSFGLSHLLGAFSILLMTFTNKQNLQKINGLVQESMF